MRPVPLCPCRTRKKNKKEETTPRRTRKKTKKEETTPRRTRKKNKKEAQERSTEQHTTQNKNVNNHEKHYIQTSQESSKVKTTEQ
jgi:hypothetical protein